MMLMMMRLFWMLCVGGRVKEKESCAGANQYSLIHHQTFFFDIL
jgi:hypothetical protein